MNLIHKSIFIKIVLISQILILIALSFLVNDGMPSLVISIKPETAQKSVIFRGAIVDGKWKNVDDIAISVSDWKYVSSDKTFISSSDTSLKIRIYYKDTIKLVFNTGDKYSNAIISYDNKNTILRLNSFNEDPQGKIFPVSADNHNQYNWFNSPLGVIILISSLLITLNITIGGNNNPQHAVKRNGLIEISRFFAILAVALIHFNSIAFPKGYLGVEFFYLISGYFLAKELNKTNQVQLQTVEKASLKQLSKLSLLLLLSLLITLYIYQITQLDYLKQINITNFASELLLLDAFGLNFPRLIPAGWFISGLIISSLILRYSLYRFGQRVLIIIGPVISIFILVYINSRFGNLNVPLDATRFGTIPFGTLRAFAELTLGASVFEFSKMIPEVWSKKFATHNQIFIIFIILGYLLLVPDSPNYDIIFVILLMLYILASINNNGLFVKLCSNKIAWTAGSVSVGVFLFHQIFYDLGISEYLLRGYGWHTHAAMNLIFTLLFSLIFIRLYEKILSLFKN